MPKIANYYTEHCLYRSKYDWYQTGMNKMKKILILQPYLDQSRSIAKFLKKYTSDYQIVGGFLEENIFFRRIPYFDVTTPLSLDRLMDNPEFDVIIPTGAKSTKIVLSRMKQLSVGNVLFKADNLLAFDKCTLLRVIKGLGIPIPITYRNVHDCTEYPIFYKEAFEEGGGRRGIFYKKEDIAKICTDESLIYQEWINTPHTYGVGFLACDGKVVTHFMHKELLSAPKIGGSGVIITKYHDDRLLAYSKKILEHLQYSGLGLLEFKFCPKRNDFVFMELNPKFWASIEFAFLNNPIFFKELFGIDYPSYNVECIMYLNRLASFGVQEYITLGVQYRTCYKVNFIDSLVEFGKSMYRTRVRI